MFIYKNITLKVIGNSVELKFFKKSYSLEMSLYTTDTEVKLEFTWLPVDTGFRGDLNRKL